MLVSFAFGRFINTDHVRAVEEYPADPKIGQERCQVTFTDGTTKVINRPLERLEWATGRLIQAPHGYSTIEAFPPDQFSPEPSFTTWPVIAFRTTDTSPVPITPLGEPGDDRTWALVLPDGRCDSPYDQVFPTVDAFKAAYRDLIAIQRAESEAEA